MFPFSQMQPMDCVFQFCAGKKGAYPPGSTEGRPVGIQLNLAPIMYIIIVIR